MNAKKKEIETIDLSSLNLNHSELVDSRTEQLDLALPSERKKGIILEGATRETASKLVSILRNEAKIV